MKSIEDLTEFIIFNKEELRKDLKQDVKLFLANKTFFNGLFKKAFEKQLNLFIIQQLKLNLMRDLTFDLTFDKICDTISEEFLRYFTSDYFFEYEYYEE